jgi:hypothetical protein
MWVGAWSPNAPRQIIVDRGSQGKSAPLVILKCIGSSWLWFVPLQVLLVSKVYGQIILWGSFEQQAFMTQSIKGQNKTKPNQCWQVGFFFGFKVLWKTKDDDDIYNKEFVKIRFSKYMRFYNIISCMMISFWHRGRHL